VGNPQTRRHSFDQIFQFELRRDDDPIILKNQVVTEIATELAFLHHRFCHEFEQLLSRLKVFLADDFSLAYATRLCGNAKSDCELDD